MISQYINTLKESVHLAREAEPRLFSCSVLGRLEPVPSVTGNVQVPGQGL